MSKNEGMELFIGLAIVFAGIVAGLLIAPAILLVAMVLGGAIAVSAGNEETIVYDVTVVESDEEES